MEKQMKYEAKAMYNFTIGQTKYECTNCGHVTYGHNVDEGDIVTCENCGELLEVTFIGSFDW